MSAPFTRVCGGGHDTTRATAYFIHAAAHTHARDDATYVYARGYSVLRALRYASPHARCSQAGKTPIELAVESGNQATLAVVAGLISAHLAKDEQAGLFQKVERPFGKVVLHTHCAKNGIEEGTLDAGTLAAALVDADKVGARTLTHVTPANDTAPKTNTRPSAMCPGCSVSSCSLRRLEGAGHFLASPVCS